MPPFQISRRRFVQRCAQAAALTGLPAWFVEERLAAAETAPAAPLALAPDGPGPKAAMAPAARPESWKPPVIARAAPAGLAAL